MGGILSYYNRKTEQWTARELQGDPTEVDWPGYDTGASGIARGSGISSLLRTLEQATLGTGEHLQLALWEEGAVGGGAGETPSSGGDG